MSVDISISLGVIVFLIFIIRYINRTKSEAISSRLVQAPLQPRSKVSFPQEAVSSPSVDLKSSVDDYFFNDFKEKLPDNFLNFNLLNNEKLSQNQQQKVEEISQSFRRPHPLLLPLTQSTFEPNELFDLIKTDAEMTAKILKVVNSSLFALRQPITNINHAIIFLGVIQVKNIAMQFAVLNDVKFEDKAQNEAYQKIWLASYMASSFCLLLTKELAEENAAELSTRCLLSYLGDLAMLSYKPSMAGYYLDSFSLFERIQIAQGSLDTNAALVGKHIAQQWQLPQALENGIGNSLLPLTKQSLSNELTEQERRNMLICYLSCRLGDLVAFHGLRDVSALTEISFEALGRAEVYYIQDNIEQAGLSKINALIADANFRKKVNKLINQLSA